MNIITYYIIQLTDYANEFICCDGENRTKENLTKDTLFMDLDSATERLDDVTNYEEAVILSVILDDKDNILTIEFEEY